MGLQSKQYHSDRLIEQVLELRREFSEYTRSIRDEMRKKKQLIRALKILQEWAGRAITVETDSLGRIRLIDGSKVEIKEEDGKLLHKSIADFEYGEMISIVRAFIEEIRKLAVERMIERSMVKKPRLMLRVIHERGRIPLITSARCVIEIANNGGDALHLKLFTYIGKLRQYGPFDIMKKKSIEINLGSRPIDIDSFKVWLYCSDSDGFAYVGKAIIYLERRAWTKVDLKSDKLIS